MREKPSPAKASTGTPPAWQFVALGLMVYLWFVGVVAVAFQHRWLDAHDLEGLARGTLVVFLLLIVRLTDRATGSKLVAVAITVGAIVTVVSLVALSVWFAVAALHWSLTPRELELFSVLDAVVIALLAAAAGRIYNAGPRETVTTDPPRPRFARR